MTLVHRRDDTEHILATRVETADSLLDKARGLMFRRSIPDDYALVFPFDRAGRRSLHMLFVPFDIDALWLRDGRVQQRARLPAWTGIAWGVAADTVVELPAGAATEVRVGDTVEVRSNGRGDRAG